MGQSSREEGKSSSNLIKYLAKWKPVYEKGKISWGQPRTSKERQLPGQIVKQKNIRADMGSWF